MRLDWWTLGLQTVNFGILVWLLHRFLYKPVLAMIDARKAEIRSQLDAAKETEAKARVQLSRIETERAGIAAEREAALKAAASQAQELAEARRAQTEREAQALIDATRKKLAEEFGQALDEAKRLALDLGADFAQRLLAEVPMQYRADAWIERIEQHFGTLSQAEREALKRQLNDGQSLRVVTACALPAATTELWKERLRKSLGVPGGAITFGVNSELIAGAELHFPTAILRFSWQSALLAARTEVGVRARPR
jgi:F-type H+-transporting ATPase subunit b